MIRKQDIGTFQVPQRILLRERDFVYILPHPALREQVSNYTITYPSKEILSDRYTVIPHGSATLVFSLDQRGFYGNLFGPITKPCVVGSLANQSEMLLIIEFQPAGLSAFTGFHQKELANQIIPFDMVNPLLNRLVLETLEKVCSLEQLIAQLDRLLFEHLHTNYPPELQLATSMIIKSLGALSCKELSTHVHYSERHLNRIFDAYLGMNVKTLFRMVRINRAIRLMQNPQYSILRVSCETGFYDSSHFIHDFKSICGVTPQEYRNNKSDFYNEIAKY